MEVRAPRYRSRPLRPHPDVEPATAGGAVDGGVEIKLLGRALAGEAAEATERDLDVPGAELLRIVEIPELALVPDLDGATLSPAVLADADAFRIVAIGAERGGAAGADPLAAALVPPLLLPQSCFPRLHDLVPGAERLDLLHLPRRQVKLGHFVQPFFGVRHRLDRKN